MSWLSYIARYPSVVWHLSVQHAVLSLEGTALAAVIAIPFGILAYRRRSLRDVSKAVTEVIQTIPSLALLAILMVWFGMGNTTLVVTLFLYALMPLLHNTVEGLVGVDPSLVDVATGLGMSRTTMLLRVQLPLAFSLLLTGLRVALVTSIGIATIGVFIGAGGLGKLIYGGMQILDPAEITAGALPAAVMAIVIDGALATVSRRRERATRSAGLKTA